MTPERKSCECFDWPGSPTPPTILDVVLPDEGDHLLQWIQEVLPWTDYFFPNNDESAQLLGGEMNPQKQARRFRELGAKTVVIVRQSGIVAGLTDSSPEIRVSLSNRLMRQGPVTHLFRVLCLPSCQGHARNLLENGNRHGSQLRPQHGSNDGRFQ
ncbi:MAG: hypothetical protein U0941_22125 [Planctomycetaceae bacterium]